MKFRTLFAVIFVAAMVSMTACNKGGGSPTGPDSNQLPVTTIQPGVEVYTPSTEKGQSVYAQTYLGKINFPDGCLKAEPRRISPARGSKLPDNYEVAIDLVDHLCAEAPLSAMGENVAITPMYDMVDAAGNHATDWLSGGAGPVAPGQARNTRWASKVYGNIPPYIKGLRVRWRWGRNGGSTDYLRYENGDPLGGVVEVIIPLDWSR